MDGFKNLEIKNFRGIEHLTVDDLSRVNVFLGQNSSGKSSVLESLLLLMGMSNPDLPQSINYIRSRGFSSFADLGYMFHNGNLKVSPEFSSEMFDGSKRHLALEMTYTFDEKAQVDLPQGHIPTSETKTFLNTLKMLFEIEANQKKSNYESSVTFNQMNQVTGKKIAEGYESSVTFNQMNQVTGKKIAEGYLEKNTVAFLPADIALGVPTNDLVELAKRKKKEIITKYLSNFDSHITTWEILNNVAYIGLDGIDQLMMVNMMGDGMRRYLNIVAASANPMNNIILIDEIDNGLHYSAYKKLWEAIFALATDTNKQVFVTTHSKETLYRLNEMLEEHSEYQDALRLYTIENTKLKGHQAYKYTYEGLAEACNNDIEIRSVVL